MHTAYYLLNKFLNKVMYCLSKACASHVSERIQ